MHKKRYAIGVLAVAVAAVIPASALASVDDVKLTVAATPTKVSKKGKAPKYPTPVALRVDVDTTYSATSPPPVAPSPAATSVNIDLDNDFRFTTKGVARCNPTTLTGTTTEVAIALCGKSKIGTGSAVLAGAAGPATAVITAFNATPVNGQPQILLHSRVSAPLNTTAILPGVLSPSPLGGDYGKRLVVTVPPLASGFEVFTHFDTTVNRRFKVKKKVNGKTKKVKSGYVTAVCKDKNKTWNFQGLFNYSTFPPNAPATSSLTRSATQVCQPKK